MGRTFAVQACCPEQRVQEGHIEPGELGHTSNHRAGVVVVAGMWVGRDKQSSGA